MILLLAAIGSIFALIALVVRPTIGVAALFLIRPLVDTTWNTPVMGGFHLTEIVSAAVPLIIVGQMIYASFEQSALRMPLRIPWLLWTADVFLFATIIMFSQSLTDGANVLLRHLNGLAGFYMVQRYFAGAYGSRMFAWILVLSSLFPISTGLYEAVTGHHWNLTYGEDGVVRNIGLYHDAITIRYYALQGLLGSVLVFTLSPRDATLRKVLSCAYALAALVVVKGAFSKSGTLIVLAWALAWPILRRNYLLLLLFASAALATVVYYIDAVMTSIGFVFTKELAAIGGSGEKERIFSGRWYLWDEMLQRWKGFSTAQKLFGSGETALGAHNDFLQILFHGGFIGLAIYMALLVSVSVAIVMELSRRRDPLILAALLALIMWTIDAIGLVPSAYSGYQWFVWGVIGLGLRKSEIDGKSQTDPSAATWAPRFPNIVDSR